MKKEFTIQGEPKGKARPRFGQGHTYTPKATAEYEAKVGYEYTRQCEGYKFSFDGDKRPVSICINAFFAIPKSASKKVKAQMVIGDIKPTKKPDADNIAKIIMDGLNGIAFDDDAQVVSLVVNKLYSIEPCVYVVVGDVE